MYRNIRNQEPDGENQKQLQNPTQWPKMQMVHHRTRNTKPHNYQMPKIQGPNKTHKLQ